MNAAMSEAMSEDWLARQLEEFAASPARLRQSARDHAQDPVGNFALFQAVRAQVQALGVPVEDRRLDAAELVRWMADWPELTEFYRPYGGFMAEKCLEHFITTREAAPKPGDVLVDVAAAGSPYAGALERRGVAAYRLDLSYPPGVSGRRIGADATATGLPEAFADALTLHCAYECFMGDADTGLLAEAARILKPGGRLVIAPLYLEDGFINITSPRCDQSLVAIDPGAERVWRDDPWEEPFARHYSAAAFVERVWSRLPACLSGQVLFFPDIPALMRTNPGQLIYCLFALRCVKAG
ncbi:Methyltransferase domain-containing protein [Humidesulfovibrio mexicanus]|uniref:Methyltransferase domain-containing protein n=1 Tax=Humidesulfovibrio mexicanus TaxID=147047 RepID=A0A239BV63_9BACT|nr:methyltransferase domain-containing protein [Humidesulfovibrio mexicanus]SNS11935.1 Methyltransferase domain-containing protein [Humidesulfovibrio mexicanus]